MYEKRIDNGIRFLDEHLGPEWPHRIDLNTLELTSCTTCVCGQLFGGEAALVEEIDTEDGYDYVSNYLLTAWEDRVGCGFALGVYGEDDELDEDEGDGVLDPNQFSWKLLTDEWKAVIKTLQDSRVSEPVLELV